MRKRERRYSRGVEVGEKKVRAQHQMLSNKLQLGTKNTKDKKRNRKIFLKKIGEMQSKC